MSDLLDAALDYAKRGWLVIPLHAPRADDTCSCEREDCASPAKHPRLQHGLHDASTDPKKLRAWWKRWPTANVGIVTGAGSGLVVLDVDPAHGGDASLNHLEDEHGDLAVDARALTGGEGYHYLFAHPGVKVRNNAGTKLGAGLDVRGDGGYICFTAGHQVIRKGKRHSARKGFNKLVPIEQIVAGDVLMAYDEATGRVVETTVQEAGPRSVAETVLLKFGRREGVVRLTKEHPLYTTRGWVQAGDLQIGDELFHVDANFVNLPTPKYRAPKGTQPPPRRDYSQRPYRQQVPSHRAGRATGYERFLLSVAAEVGVPVRYVGDGSLVIQSREFRLQPDFIIEDTKKVIEVSIDWHHFGMTGAPDTALRRMTMAQRVELYEDAGYECLFIDATAWGSGYNEHTLGLIDQLRKQLVEYAGNGLRVEFVTTLVDDVEVFNLHCEPHNNYFVKRLNKGGKYLLAHNCAAPSRHISGNRYEWLALADELPSMPDWLLELLREQPPPQRHTPLSSPAARAGTSRYAEEALDRECADVAAAPEGNRNHTLNRAAFNLGQLVAGGELGEHEVIDRLTSAAVSAGLFGSEINATISSGLRTGMGSPRTAPPPTTTKTTTRRRASTNGDDDGHDEPPPPDDDDDAPEDYERGPSNLSDTDLGNARRLVEAHGHEIRYVPQWGIWLVWDGIRWVRDVTGEVERRAKHVAEAILTEAIGEPSKDAQKRRIKFAFDSQRRARLEAMIALARTEPGIPVEPHDLDADPWVLNAQNGTIDLRTGQLHRHDRRQLITKLAPIVYDPDAVHATWEAFLEGVTGADRSMADFLRRAVGYSLTGSTAEEVLFFVHGPAAAGKSTFIDSVEAALGDYARRADFETFLARNQATAGAARGDIARLAGARYVVSVEVDEGAKLAEGLVKTLTGGDMITARFLYRDEFEFRPQFKLWLAANYAPRVHHGDEAIWRRILRIPFEHVIPAGDRDPAVKATLRDAEGGGPAILAWAVSGCLDWARRGLATPDVITAATHDYRAEQDPLREFIEDACIIGADLWIPAAALRKAYDDWAHENGLRHTLSPKAFRDTLEERGVRADRTRIMGKQTRIWRGIGLTSPNTIGETAAEALPDEQGELV